MAHTRESCVSLHGHSQTGSQAEQTHVEPREVPGPDGQVPEEAQDRSCAHERRDGPEHAHVRRVPRLADELLHRSGGSHDHGRSRQDAWRRCSHGHRRWCSRSCDFAVLVALDGFLDLLFAHSLLLQEGHALRQRRVLHAAVARREVTERGGCTQRSWLRTCTFGCCRNLSPLSTISSRNAILSPLACGSNLNDRAQEAW